jgi:hypothetical protein
MSRPSPLEDFTRVEVAKQMVVSNWEAQFARVRGSRLAQLFGQLRNYRDEVLKSWDTSTSFRDEHQTKSEDIARE